MNYAILHTLLISRLSRRQRGLYQGMTNMLVIIIDNDPAALAHNLSGPFSALAEQIIWSRCRPRGSAWWLDERLFWMVCELVIP